MDTIKKFFKLISAVEPLPALGITYNVQENMTTTRFSMKSQGIIDISVGGNLFDLKDETVLAMANPSIFTKIFPRLSDGAKMKIDYDQRGNPDFLLIKDGSVKHKLVLSDPFILTDKRPIPQNPVIASVNLSIDQRKILSKNKATFDEARMLSFCGERGKISFVFGNTGIKKSNITKIEVGDSPTDFTTTYLPTKLVENLLINGYFCEELTLEIYERYVTFKFESAQDNITAMYIMALRKQIDIK